MAAYSDEANHDRPAAAPRDGPEEPREDEVGGDDIERDIGIQIRAFLSVLTHVSGEDCNAAGGQRKSSLRSEASFVFVEDCR